MRPISRAITLVLIGVTFAAFVEGAHSAGGNLEDARPSVDVVPIVRLEADSPLEVRLAFEPSTDQPVRYLYGDEKLPMSLVSFRLQKEGKAVRSPQDAPDIMLRKEHIKELKPGERLIHTVNLREMFGPLKPGTYTLEVRGSGGPRSSGLSQLHLQRRVLYVEVVDPKAP
jgi:hypothetical protein